MTCPVCKADSEGGHQIGDSVVVVCPRCGGYRLSNNALDRITSGEIKVTPDRFKDIVKEQRGESEDYPLITSYDLE